jgi:hypothetical protein
LYGAQRAVEEAHDKLYAIVEAAALDTFWGDTAENFFAYVDTYLVHSARALGRQFGEMAKDVDDARRFVEEGDTSAASRFQ